MLSKSTLLFTEATERLDGYTAGAEITEISGFLLSLSPPSSLPIEGEVSLFPAEVIRIIPACSMRAYASLFTVSSCEKPLSEPSDRLTISAPRTIVSSSAFNIELSVAPPPTSENTFIIISWASGATPENST